MVIINFRYKHNSIFEIAEVFSSVACFGHVILQPQNHKYIFQIICFIWQLLVRKTAIIVYGSLFEDLYRKRFYFWKYDLFGKIKGNQYRKRMATCVSLIKFIWGVGAFSIAVHSGAPIFVENLPLSHACWIPGDNFVIQVILHVLETVFYFETTLLVGVFDEFYLLICTELKIQFELLSKTIKSINIGTEFSRMHEDMCWRKLKRCSKYHMYSITQDMANLPPFRLKSRKPLWKEEFLMEPFSKSDYWKQSGKM
jgi:hypothetical protein